MGMRGRVASFAAGRPRPFLVTAPGATAARLAMEAELRRRGWCPVVAPAAAGLLIVCGEPEGRLEAAVDAAWDDLPGPCSLVQIGSRASAEEIAANLDRAARELADVEAQRRDAVARLELGPWSPAADEMGDHESMEHGSMHHGSMGHGGHGGHEHHMGAPAGLAMADRAEDRDGLKLDVLHVPLGPLLSDWPSGLCVRLTLQGDVVQAAEIEAVGAPASASSFWDEPWLRAAAGERVTNGEAERRRAAAHLDSVARLLAVAGWPSAADRARVLRDEVLAGGEVEASFRRFARRAGRSWTLRWMLRYLGVIDRAAVERLGLAGPAARYPGDVVARLGGWLEEIGRALDRVGDETELADDVGPRGPVGRQPSAALLDVLPTLLEGAELSAVRLIVASLDPDLEQLTTAAEVSHG
jgi:hypothetical protein